MCICPRRSRVQSSRTIFNTRAWVFHWAKPFYAFITEEDEYWGALLGITEMLRSGTTCSSTWARNTIRASLSAPWSRPASAA